MPGSSGVPARGRPASWSRGHVRAAGPGMSGPRAPGTEAGPGGQRGVRGTPESGVGVIERLHKRGQAVFVRPGGTVGVGEFFRTHRRRGL